MNHRRRKYCPGVCIAGTAYRVIRFIGSGAMGAVYEVEHRDLQKAFVMKMLHEDLVDIDDSVRRLRRESQLLARLEHVNIVKVTDAGFTASRVPFFVMERLHGETLALRMRRQEKWPVAEVVQLSLGVLDGLLAAHSLGIVHRDVKPSNIFLAQDSGVKLLDFGIAKSVDVDACATAKGITLGTPRYMSPEQAMGGQADFRSDLYALGVVMYELLAGVHPFSHALTPVEMMIAQAGWKAPPLLVEDDAYFGLHRVVESLLSKDPNSRPKSAKAVKRAILDLAHHNVRRPPLSNETKVTCVVEPRRRSHLSERWLLICASLAVVGVSAIHVTPRAMNARAAELPGQPVTGAQAKPTDASPLISISEGILQRAAPKPPNTSHVPAASSAERGRTPSVARTEGFRGRRLPGPSGIPSAAPSAWPGDLVDLTRR